MLTGYASKGFYPAMVPSFTPVVPIVPLAAFDGGGGGKGGFGGPGAFGPPPPPPFGHKGKGGYGGGATAGLLLVQPVQVVQPVVPVASAVKPIVQRTETTIQPVVTVQPVVTQVLVNEKKQAAPVVEKARVHQTAPTVAPTQKKHGGAGVAYEAPSITLVQSAKK